MLSLRPSALANRQRQSLAKHLFKIVALVVVVVPFLATLLAVWLLWDRAVHGSDLLLLAAMYTVVAFGVTVGFHRMLTHRSFRPHPVVRAVLLVLGSMSCEGAAVQWAATHLKHHAHADRAGDPHSPLEGFVHAHLGWIFAETAADPALYCRHLLHDPVVVFISRTFLLWAALALVIPCALGGLLAGWAGAWTGLLWGGLVRMFLTHHVTWSVNSVCHLFGKRAFATKDRSRNEWVVGLLAFGEGWHNNHHAFPRSAFHGLHWWQVDVAGYLIWTLERLGLAHDVYRIPPALLVRGRGNGRLAVRRLLPAAPLPDGALPAAQLTTSGMQERSVRIGGQPRASEGIALGEVAPIVQER